MTDVERAIEAIRRRERWAILVGAFLAWMFAGLEISLFVLIHRQMIHGLLGADTPEAVVTKWFAWFQVAFLLGAAAGGWLYGIVGDVLGRVMGMALAVGCYSFGTLMCYITNWPDMMLIFRFVACLGIGGVWPNAVALVSEAWPNTSRPVLAGLLGAAANFGFVLLGAICYFFPVTNDSWRWVLLVGAAPGLLLVWLLIRLPESPRMPRGGRTESPLREVLRPPLLSRTILGITLGAIPVVGSAANANWLVPWTDQVATERARESGSAVTKPDARGKAKTQMTRSGGAIFGSLLGGVIASVLGRRLSYFLISLGALAVSSWIFGRLDPLHPQFQLFAFLLGFIGITYFGWLPLFLPELFPTRVRSTGTGISFNTGRVVAAMVVLSAGFLLDQFAGDYAQVGLCTGLIYGVGMIVIWFVPRRSNGRLED